MCQKGAYIDPIPLEGQNLRPQGVTFEILVEIHRRGRDSGRYEPENPPNLQRKIIWSHPASFKNVICFKVYCKYPKDLSPDSPKQKKRYLRDKP